MGNEDAGFFIGLGVVLLLSALCLAIMLLRTWGRRRRWTPADGTVTSVKTKRRNDGETQTTVHYRYADATGQQHSGTDTPLLRAPRRKGHVTVVYDPASPSRSEIVSAAWLWSLLALSVLMVGGGLWAVAAGMAS